MTATNETTPLDSLLGGTITALAVSNDEEFLKFSTDTGDIIYEGYGDCCSTTWFADILGVGALLGGVVTEIRDLPLPNYNADDGRGRREEDKVYGWQLITDKGHVDIIFRNSSNGYYGGGMFEWWEGKDWESRDHDEPPESWVNITEDWSA